MNLQSLLACLPQYKIYGEGNPIITSIEMDSRHVREGSLFICIKGFTVDGHDFANGAVQKGAKAIIAEHELDVDVPVIVVNDTKRTMAVLADYYYEHPTHKLQLIGVTGTNGKTTVTHILDKIFKDQMYKTGLIGTINMKIGNKTYNVNNTTPESLLLQKTFKSMVDEQVTTAFMEVSSHALHMGRVRGCDFNIAVFTNLTQDHLDYHKTMNEYRHAKGLLFAQLGNRYEQDNPKFAILNRDDEASEEYMNITAAHVLTYGIDKKADVMAKNIKMSGEGTAFTLETPQGNIEVQINLVGTFSVYNILAASSAALVSNIELNKIKKSVETLEGVPGRFELINEGQSFPVIVDYAHTPDSLENVLITINQFVKGKIIVVIGCGGDRDRKKRPLMAAIATKYGDYPIFTSDNPRTEDPVQILQDMEDGVKDMEYKTIIDRKQAIFHAIQTATDEDVVLIAGKGHETYQQIGDMTYDFDDRLIAREALKERI